MSMLHCRPHCQRPRNKCSLPFGLSLPLTFFLGQFKPRLLPVLAGVISNCPPTGTTALWDMDFLFGLCNIWRKRQKYNSRTWKHAFSGSTLLSYNLSYNSQVNSQSAGDILGMELFIQTILLTRLNVQILLSKQLLQFQKS